MKLLNPNEVLLEGHWIKTGAQVIADDTARRIDELVSSHLRKVATSTDGWEVLYLDEQDGRLWELSYPHKEWHGGGPPSLTNLSREQAERKYRL